MHTLSICRTCPRDARDSGAVGLDLADRLRGYAARAGIGLLRVNCLGACRLPCSIALDAPDKPRLRYSGLQRDDAAAIEALLLWYLHSPNGPADVPGSSTPLRAALTAVLPKPTPSLEIDPR